MAQAADESKAMESEVFLSKYRKIKTVGKGSFGEAVLVRSKADGKRYIAKAIETSAMNPKEKRDVQNEIAILSRVNHPNIVRYQEHFEDGTLMFIVMEYADGGDLSTRIKDAKKEEPAKPFDPKLSMFWFLQITLALKYLHDNHILHRDLKTANIFLTSKNVVKLGDFGISTVLQNTMACAKTVCGTPYYFSPELCQSKPYNNKSDVWALGVVFYEMLTLGRPFNAKSLKELVKKIVAGQYEPVPASVPNEMRSLCTCLLQLNPVQRPSINRILESPYVQEQLKAFSADIEAEATKDKAEFDTKPPPPATRPAPAAAAPAAGAAAPPAAPQLSEREQMAQLRGMNRENMRAAMAQQASAPASAPAAGGGAPSTANDGPEIDDDGDYIKHKQYLAKESREMVGKQLNSHPDEFGDNAPPAAAADETITLSNGKTVPAKDVRGVLEGEMGVELVRKAMDYLSSALSSPQAPSAAEIQREVNVIVGLRFAHNSNALAKLAMWESKLL